MKLRMIGCSHHTTPVEVREKFSFTDAQSEAALNLLKDRYSDCESVLLSTCNRVELYVGTAMSEARVPEREELLSFMAEFHQLSLENYESYFTSHLDSTALAHLFTVASSIDSLVVGESQIASQVNNAYERAVRLGFAGPVMHAAFQHANQVAKRVTNETEIHRRRISVPSVAVSEIASELFERFDDKQILLIGSGEMGRESLTYLMDAGAKNVVIINRSLENAKNLANDFGVGTGRWEELDSAIAQADLIVSTTGATQPIVTEERFRKIMQTRKKGDLLILDLAVPRDFEAAIGRLPDVFLKTVDDLQAVCEQNRSFREQQLPRARRIITEEVDRIMADWQIRASGETIRALRNRAIEIRDAELARLIGKQSMQGVSEEMEREITHAFDRLVNKLLHQPLQSIREVAQADQRDSLISAVRRLFQIR
ncbi:MAG: glutamyl-tRNA reductase [Pirellula sp.]|jgi:glutamyl-tRNA reductase|nr:glutamyl-tRNA reductase [Pirellula sp.]